MTSKMLRTAMIIGVAAAAAMSISATKKSQPVHQKDNTSPTPPEGPRSVSAPSTDTIQ